MKLEEVQVEVGELRPGMFVCRLDRPWAEAPFPMQGFYVGDKGEQLAWLRRHCRLVWIDIERGAVSLDAPTPRAVAGPVHTSDRLIGRAHYDNRVKFEEELPAARKAHDEALRIAMQALHDVQRGRKLAFDDISTAAESIVESVLRNADTLFWVNALQRHGSYAYRHAINCCALASAFGRHLGLPADSLVDLAAGGLLLDIGKTRLPAELLQHPGPLDDNGLALAQSHVGLGLDILAESQAAWPASVEEMLRTHHERWNGSGYPGKLAGHAIPLFGRMAAIVDSFEAMTSARPHLPARARHEALQELYRNRSLLYHGELVEQFTACLGVYPTGSLVELNTGEVAVVMTQNPTRRLRPVVTLLTDAGKAQLRAFRQLDLMAEQEGVQGGSVSITRPLPVGAFGLDPAELFL